MSSPTKRRPAESEEPEGVSPPKSVRLSHDVTERVSSEAQQPLPGPEAGDEAMEVMEQGGEATEESGPGMEVMESEDLEIPGLEGAIDPSMWEDEAFAAFIQAMQEETPLNEEEKEIAENVVGDLTEMLKSNYSEQQPSPGSSQRMSMDEELAASIEYPSKRLLAVSPVRSSRAASTSSEASAGMEFPELTQEYYAHAVYMQLDRLYKLKKIPFDPDYVKSAFSPIVNLPNTKYVLKNISCERENELVKFFDNLLEIKLKEQLEIFEKFKQEHVKNGTSCPDSSYLR